MKKTLVMLKKRFYSIEDLKTDIEQIMKDGSTISLKTATPDLELVIKYNEESHMLNIKIRSCGIIIYSVDIRDLLLILYIVEVSNDNSFTSDKLDVKMFPTGDLLFSF